MPHYKDPQNNVHFIDSTEFEYLLPFGCVQITDSEADSLRAPVVNEPDPIEKLKLFLEANPDVKAIL